MAKVFDISTWGNVQISIVLLSIYNTPTQLCTQKLEWSLLSSSFLSWLLNVNVTKAHMVIPPPSMWAWHYCTTLTDEVNATNSQSTDARGTNITPTPHHTKKGVSFQSQFAMYTGEWSFCLKESCLHLCMMRSLTGVIAGLRAVGHLHSNKMYLVHLLHSCRVCLR